MVRLQALSMSSTGTPSRARSAATVAWAAISCGVARRCSRTTQKLSSTLRRQEAFKPWVLTEV